MVGIESLTPSPEITSFAQISEAFLKKINFQLLQVDTAFAGKMINCKDIRFLQEEDCSFGQKIVILLIEVMGKRQE